MTRKYLCMSASAGATPWIFVYAWMKAKYCPCNFVNRVTDSSLVAERLKAHRRRRRSRRRPVQRRVSRRSPTNGRAATHDAFFSSTRIELSISRRVARISVSDRSAVMERWMSIHVPA